MKWRRARARPRRRELSCCHNPAMKRLREERTLAHTHTRTHTRTRTHICLMGECCVCEVGLAWGVGGGKSEERGMWGEMVTEKCLEIASNWDHVHFFFLPLLHPWSVYGTRTSSCGVPSKLIQKKYVHLWITQNDREALDTCHSQASPTPFSPFLYFSFSLPDIPFFFNFMDDGKNSGWKI